MASGSTAPQSSLESKLPNGPPLLTDPCGSPGPGGSAGAAQARPGNTGPQVDPSATTRVVEINDLVATEAALAAGDVAAILIEPALTNIGIVLPDPGYHAALRTLATKYGALLIADETHTISLGPGGATAAWSLQPDLLVIGKAIAGGLPGAAYGMRRELTEQIAAELKRDEIDTGGIGGTVGAAARRDGGCGGQRGANG